MADNRKTLVGKNQRANEEVSLERRSQGDTQREGTRRNNKVPEISQRITLRH